MLLCENTMDAMKLRITAGRVSVIIVLASVCSFAPQTVGQISEEISEEDRAEIEAFLERERGMAQDPMRRPPPMDDPSELDVAKRRRFLWDLGTARLDFGCFVSFDLLKEATDDIPQERRGKLLERWSTLLADDFRPTSPEVVQWYGQWLSYRGGSRLHLIVAEWSAGDFVVRASQLADSGRYVRILLRFPKRQSLEFHRMPTDFGGESWDWEFVSKTQLRAVLVDFFDLPYTANAAFRLNLRINRCTGADVFTGRFRSRQAPGRKVDQNTNAANGSSFAGVPERILITDSDPQYMCVSFDLQQTPQKELEEP